MDSHKAVSSPIATGGAGTFFEQHVDALFLALLLVRGIPPILTDCQVEEVHLQTGHLDWRTDDLLVVGTRRADERCCLAAQVKRPFSISLSDDDCRQVFAGFWADFNDKSRFSADRDRLALITLHGTNILLNDFNNFLDCARASLDGNDLAQRLRLKGYLSKKAKNQGSVVKTIVEEAAGRQLTDDEYWRFLRVIHVVSFDLNTETAQTEAWIKSLLAFTSHEGDPIAAADATWQELLKLVGSGVPVAASYVYDRLPESMRERHGIATGGGSLNVLRAHSQTTLDGIRTNIARTVSIDRGELVAGILARLKESQVVVVTGPAGVGKSALAKAAIELLREDAFCLAFRAEEFASSHVDSALHQMQVSITAQQLLALLAAQGRKIILVESVERLLETPVRDAFSDLLRLARQDQSICLLITCRDYSVETVRASLLAPADLPALVLEIPPLTHDELAQVVKAVPGLKRAMTGERLKDLLRSPYLLDRAAQMDWSDTGSMPADERSFRLKCWREIVRCDAAASGGMPRRREQVFLNLARRRARALSPYVECDDLDAEALEALRRDNLVVVSRDTTSLAAPAHDVLEDWAIVQWLSGQFLLREHEAAAFADDIGGYPAIRRGYRKWLGEMLECETASADAFVLACINDESLAAFFRDDTLVSTLLSSAATSFLTRHGRLLLAEQGRLLIQVIHLLRVACKAPPRWLSGATGIGSQLLVPAGDAWAAVLHIVSEGLDQFLPANLGLLLGLLEDWAGSVELNAPDPPGLPEAGKIAFALLDNRDAYKLPDLRKRTLTVIAKVPRANPVAFQDLLGRACTVVDRRDHTASDFAEVLLPELNSAFACRDFPEQMVKLAIAHFCLSDQDLKRDPEDTYDIGVEHCFGIRDNRVSRFFPASAIRGPFLPLLQSHPNIGLKFIIDLMNHVGTWYGEQRWHYHRLEKAWHIKLDIPGESQVTQWANRRLWSSYRGLSVVPYVLQSALMALEKWLLDICQLADLDVEPWLLRLLRDSNNVAVTAVVASVCNAYPGKGGRAALALLSSRDLIDMDRGRSVQDQLPRVSGLLSSYSARAWIYEGERTESAALPHRRHDLEMLAVRLQFGAQREEVWKILDRHRTALPPVEEQSDKHRLWRLALHRMDVRGFRAVEPPSSSHTGDTQLGDMAPEERHVYYGPGAIEEDIQSLIDGYSPIRSRQETELGLLVWGYSAWGRDKSPGVDLAQWRSRLAEAQKQEREPGEQDEIERGGPGFVAAVCARDHWDEMTSQDQEWCVTKLIEEINRNCENDDHTIRYAVNPMQPDRAAAYVLPLVLSQTTPEQVKPRLRTALARTLTHSVQEVVDYAAEGTGYYLHRDWYPFAMQCVAALAKQGRMLLEHQASEKRMPFGQQRRGRESIRSTVPEIRTHIEAGDLDVDDELNKVDLDERPGRLAARTILRILGHHPSAKLALGFHRRVLEFLVKQWNAARRDRRSSDRRDFEFESECRVAVARFVLKLPSSKALAVCEPMLAAANEYPDEVAKFIESLAFQEDLSVGQTPFWEIWQAFADQLCKASWVEGLDELSVSETELLSKIFLDLPWKEGVHHWQRLEGHVNNLDALVKRLPASAAVLHAYCRFLYQIGEQALPDAFIIVAKQLDAGNVSTVLTTENTVFYLESLLRKRVYSEPLKLKEKQKVRDAVLRILDSLVDAGSSAAFRMRDDFVTPVGSRP